MLHRQFKRDTVKGLIKLAGEIPHQQMRRGRQPTNAADLGRLSGSAGGHFLERIPPTEKKARPTRNCVVCSTAEAELYSGPKPQKRQRFGSESSYQCKSCKKSLCVVPCMELYHRYTNPVGEYKK